MARFCLDASALVKRYTAEVGSDAIAILTDALLPQTPKRMAISPLGIAEVFAVLTRKKNSGALPTEVFGKTLAALRSDLRQLDLLPLAADLVLNSIP